MLLVLKPEWLIVWYVEFTLQKGASFAYMSQIVVMSQGRDICHLPVSTAHYVDTSYTHLFSKL